MIDTLMVVWTSGIWKRLLSITSLLLSLFLVVCALSFLVTTSGGKWANLTVFFTQANAVAQPEAAAQSDATSQKSSTIPGTIATASPVAVPTTRSAEPYVAPIILQNPILPDATRVGQNSHKHTNRYHSPVYARPASSPTPTDPTLQDPTGGLQNLP